MNTSRIGLALAVAAALTACAGPAPAAAPDGGVGTTSASPAAIPAPVSEEAEVEQTFQRYYEALLGRDYRAACEINAPETTTTFVEAVTAQGVTVGTCEEAFKAVYATPGTAEATDKIATSSRIQGVTIDGDTATVNWSAEAQGQRRTVDTGFRRVDGQWRILSPSP